MNCGESVTDKNYKDCNIIDKIWGQEIWIVNDENYCHKKLCLKKGAICSLHLHPRKCETFTIESGRVKMEYGDQVKDMFPGDSVTIFPGTFHRFSGYEKSMISEVSTTHSDEDVVRKENSYLAPLLIFFDIDGTLIASDGIISKEHIGQREFGIISSRSRKRSQDICDKMNISPLAIICCRVVSRAEEMRYADKLFPIKRTLYVGDMISDGLEAARAGWDFLSPQDYIHKVENGEL